MALPRFLRMSVVCTSGLAIYTRLQCLRPGFGFKKKKKELLKCFRELFAKEKSYPSTAKIWGMYIKCAYYMPEHVAII